LQAGIQLPLPLHTLAQRTASSLPAPPVIRSTIAAVVSEASAAPIPAGSTIGQARKQSPQRVQASAIASPRAWNSSMYSAAKPPSLIRCARVLSSELIAARAAKKDRRGGGSPLCPDRRLG
jgi:hypothetical protein